MTTKEAVEVRDAMAKLSDELQAMVEDDTEVAPNVCALLRMVRRVLAECKEEQLLHLYEAQLASEAWWLEKERAA